MHDSAVFYIDEEYYEMSLASRNAQESVESQFLYILARSPSNDQQLCCTDERLDDILQIQQNLTRNDGIAVYYVIRPFKGDHLETQFESGQQKVRAYPCHPCCFDVTLSSAK